MILKLSEDVTDENLNNIIIFFQTNKFDSNNEIKDKLIYEKKDNKNNQLLSHLNTSTTINYSSSGYVNQLFSIFKNIDNFCKKESKFKDCSFCGKKDTIIINGSYHFVLINENIIILKNKFNILVENYKEIYSYDCECQNNRIEKLCCVKIKYNIVKYPDFLFVLFDLNYDSLVKNKEYIVLICESKILLNINIEYELKSAICCPFRNHFNVIIFSPAGSVINNNFSMNKIYNHDGCLNNGKIVSLNSGDDWRSLGIPHILIYKKTV